MHILKKNFFGNPFIGLYFATSDSTLIIPPQATKKQIDSYSEILDTNPIKTTIAKSNLNGLFIALNSNGIVVPKLATKKELNELKKSGLNICVLDTPHSAIGNNILTNDKAAIINPEITETQAKQIEDCLGVEVIQREIAGLKTVGSICITTNKGLLAYNNINENELKELEKIFKVKGGIGTANMGVSFIGICLTANSNGFIIGELTSGYEMQRIDEALGFLD